MNTEDLDNCFAGDNTPEPPQEFILPDFAPEPPQENMEDIPSRSFKNKPLTTLDTEAPCNLNAERVVIGAIMLDNDTLKNISTVIDVEDFYLDSHRRIVSAMESLWKEGKTIDIVTLSNELSKKKELETVGGVSFLASLTEGLPRRPVIDDYLRIVADKSIARKIMQIGSAIVERAADQSETATQTLDILEAQLIQLKDKSKILSRRRNTEPFFVGFRTFIDTYPEEIEWTVEDLIQKDGNGLILGDPGTSKSLTVFDLALHLVGGVAWFHHRIPKRVKVGLVTREDAPGLSQSRVKRLREGAPESLSMFLDGIDLEEWIYVHTRAQRETWTLQNESDIQDIIESIKERGIQICFFDVFRVLWHGNENDSRETAEVLEAAKRIGRESGCQIGLVHHVSKSDRGTIFDRARGSGILGWREWALGITIENPDAQPKDQIRKMEMQTKASVAASPIYYRIEGYESKLCLEEVEAPTQQYGYKNEKKEKKTSPNFQASMPYREDDSDVPF